MKKLMLICTSVLLAALLVSCSAPVVTTAAPTATPTATPEPTKPPVTLKVSEFTEPVCLVSLAVKNYIYDNPDFALIGQFKSAVKETRYDVSKPVTLGYELVNGENAVVESETLVVSEKADPSAAREFAVKDGKAEAFNLKVGTKYDFTFTVKLASGETLTETGSFETLRTPRILTVDGIYNVRDIGGWLTKDGKAVKQGVLYRGTELDGSVVSTYKLTEKGLAEMQNYMKIVYDTDLKEKSATPSALGESVPKVCYNLQKYSSIFGKDGKSGIKALFDDLAKPENYPMYLHCTYGVDRTGTAIILLDGVLGLSDEDIIKEYELSNLYFDHVDRNYYGSFLKDLGRKYDGADYAEKIVNYLKDIGITDEQISTLRSIFLEDVQ